jgi:hypothetical protein
MQAVEIDHPPGRDNRYPFAKRTFLLPFGKVGEQVEQDSLAGIFPFLASFGAENTLDDAEDQGSELACQGVPGAAIPVNVEFHPAGAILGWTVTLKHAFA